MKRILAIIMLVVVTMVIFTGCIPPAWLSAQETAVPVVAVANPTADAVVGFLDKVVFPALSVLVLALVGFLVRTMSKKYNLAFLASQEELIEKYALQGIAYVKETVQTKIKANSNFRLSSNDKLNQAAAHILKNMPKVSTEKAKVVVESMLARVRGEGATGADKLE